MKSEGSEWAKGTPWCPVLRQQVAHSLASELSGSSEKWREWWKARPWTLTYIQVGAGQRVSLRRQYSLLATVLQPQEKATVPCSGVTPWSIVQKLLRYRSGVLPTTQGNAWHLSTRTVESNPECVRESPWAPEIPPIMIFLHPTRTVEAVSLQLSLTL